MNQQPIMPEFGKAVYGRTGFGHGWLHIEDNKDNVYRVLPPMKSLAREGKYAKFYSTHRGFRGTDNKQRPFLCIEESDWKTKVIKVHCPICDWVEAIEKMVADYKAKGATDEQIKEYRNKYVFPFQAERKYYINVVNQEGKVGVLAIGSKMFKSLEALAKEQEKAGRDICGMEGYYVNFKKQTRFKGDREAIHTASLYMHPSSDGSYRPLSHLIDNAFAQRLSTEAADLNKLFKSLEIEQMAQIISLEGDARAKYVDTLFASQDQTATPGAAPAAQGPTQTLPDPATVAPPPMAPPVQAQAPLAPPAAAPVAPLAPPTQAFAPPGPASQAPAAPAPTFAGFNVPPVGSSPVIPGTPLAQLDDNAFANMVRPLNKG